jgi:uncharacterized membrane protein
MASIPSAIDAGGDLPPVDPGSFHICMTHLYRGEMHRMTAWRTRLDTTSHWAILVTTGMTTFALGSRELPHYVLLLGLAINTIFMLMEARRYQHLHHSRWRLQLLERNYFASQLQPVATVRDPQWRVQLGGDLERPRVTISLFLAARLRLRRNYLMLIYFITAVWAAKLFISPQTPTRLSELYARLAVAELFPSWLVAATAGFFLLTASLLALMTPNEETLERWSIHRHSELARQKPEAPQR